LSLISCHNSQLALETGSYAAEKAGRLLGRLAFQIHHTTKSCDPDAVHDLRVAIRRFAQALAVFKSCFPGKEIRKIRRRLRRIMIVAGEVRNCDIALKILSTSHSAGAASIGLKLRARREESQQGLLSLLKRWMERKSSLKWRGSLSAARALKGDAFCSVAIEETAHETLPGLARDFLKSGHAAGQANASPKRLHEFRIAAKKFRYTLELFAPLYGPPLHRWQEKIKRAQSLLGDINDSATVEEMLLHVKGGDAIARWLQKRQRKMTDEFWQHWREDFGDPDQARGWIAYLAGPVSRRTRMKKPPGRSESASRTSGRRPIAVA
jgi:CHAD domain-containing protein